MPRPASTRALALAGALLTLGQASAAHAQTAAPRASDAAAPPAATIAAPPSPAAAPSAAPAAPLAAAQPPPAQVYALPPAGSPARLPYRPGAPIPVGYHAEDHVRKGLVIGGSITLGVPYVLGLMLASAANFENKSGWLVVPVVGPVLTLALRKEHTCDTSSEDICIETTADRVVGTYLILDTLTQAGGAAMLLIGVAARKTELVRNDVANVVLLPGPVGHAGYGLNAVGTF